MVATPRRAHPIVLVHGFASSFELNWRRTGWVDLLRDAGREVLAVDLLGHGSAPKPHESAAYAQMEDTILEAIDGHEIVDAVGFSLGGTLLLRAAAQSPERFGRLVIGGVGKGNLDERDPEAVAGAIERVAGSGDAAPDPAVDATGLGRAFALFASGATNDPQALAACARGSSAIDADLLAAVRAEVLLVLGDRDFQAPLEPVADALTGAARVERRVLKGVDHFGAPQSFGFIDAALAFLDALP